MPPVVLKFEIGILSRILNNMTLTCRAPAVTLAPRSLQQWARLTDGLEPFYQDFNILLTLAAGYS